MSEVSLLHKWERAENVNDGDIMNEIKKHVLRLPLQNELGVDCNCYGIISIFIEHGLNT